MSDSLISVIVPVYKVESYLHKCVDSILAQTYQNLEIILVNDGSPDHCGAICDEYARKDPRVKVIHKKNGGIATARNAGMRIAAGDYWMFVDSDDWLEADAIANLYQLLTEYNADLAIGGWQHEDDETGRILFTNCGAEKSVSVKKNTEAMEKMLITSWTAWSKLYRREVHENVLFPEGEFNEDEAVALEVLGNCRRVVETNTLTYHYRFRSGSLMTSPFTEKHLDWHKHCLEDLDFVRGCFPELEELAMNRLYRCVFYHLQEIALAGKQYQYLAKPLKKEFIAYYPAMKKYFRKSGMYTIKFELVRYLPYSVYGVVARTVKRIRLHR